MDLGLNCPASYSLMADPGLLGYRLGGRGQRRVFRTVVREQPQGPRTNLRIDFLGYVLILPYSEGSGIKPGVIHGCDAGVGGEVSGSFECRTVTDFEKDACCCR